MVMHSRVGFTFICTKLTREHTGVKLGMNEFVRRLGETPDQAGRCRADVRTVEVRTDASPKHANIPGFTQTGVCTGRAYLLAEC